MTLRHFIYFCVLLLLLSCNNEERERGESLYNQAQSIIANCQTSNVRTIEHTISSIRGYLTEFQNSRRFDRFNELGNLIVRLQQCLEFHQVREYTRRYEQLSTRTVSGTQTAIQDLQSFLNTLNTEATTQLINRHPQIRTYIENINRIKQEFREMQSFFERNFANLASYNSEVRRNAHRFERSSFETVRNSWTSIANAQRQTQVTEDMNRMVANFEYFLRRDAEQISLINHSTYRICNRNRTHTISIGAPVQCSIYRAKVNEGVFRVYMRGAWLGVMGGTTRIQVTGRIAVMVDADRIPVAVEYQRVDFRVLDVTGDLR